LPDIPPVGDCALLFRLWDNVLPVDTTSSDLKPVKASRLAALERFGDAWIRTLSLELLPLIFGSESHCLITFLQNHANSNKFYDQVARHYELEKRLCVLPQMEIVEGNKKGAADVFEGWIACHIIERQLYDIADPLYELRNFFKELWSLRYRGLEEYKFHATVLRKPGDTTKECIMERVNWIKDEKLRRNLESLDRKTKFHIGYRIIKDGEVQCFIPGYRMEDADWTTYTFRDNPSSDLSTISLTVEREGPKYIPPSTLFRQYQLKSSDAVQNALLLAKDSGVTDWETLIHDCQSWIRELSDLASQPHLHQTDAMLYRQLVHFPHTDLTSRLTCTFILVILRRRTHVKGKFFLTLLRNFLLQAT
jgi:hypothetical protein